MKILSALSVTIVASLVSTSIVQAHHSGSAYQIEPLWVQGTVVSFQRTNPHTVTVLETLRDDGRVQRWQVEGPSMRRLGRSGTELYFPEAGDELKFCAFPFRPVAELQQIWPEVDYSERPYFQTQETAETVTQNVAGHILDTPGGDKQAWESHGIMAACFRDSNDESESWLNFIRNSNTDVWCAQSQYAVVQQQADLADFIEKTNVLLGNPCERTDQ